MFNSSVKSLVASGSAVLFVAALGTHALGAGEGSRGITCRDLGADITAIRLALGVVDGKVDQSNQSSAAIRLALGVLDGKVDQSNAELATVRSELQLIREALLAQAQGNGGLQLQVEVDETSCASGVQQCTSTILPSSFNQMPVELKLLVMRDQVSVTNLESADFDMTAAFVPEGGPNIAACAAREPGCGSPEFFINRGNGGYQLWVHPRTENWVHGTYSLLLRVTDTEGRIARKLVNVSIDAGTGDAPIPPTPAPGPGRTNQNMLDEVN